MQQAKLRTDGGVCASSPQQRGVLVEQLRLAKLHVSEVSSSLMQSQKELAHLSTTVCCTST